MDVCFTPDMVTSYNLLQKTVVVTDVLRASTSITAAIHGGVLAIRPVEQIHRRQYWKDRGYLLGGERGGIKIDGFDLGNSPQEYLKAGESKQKIIMTTTNGTRAIQATKHAKVLIVGSFLNLEAVAQFLLADPNPLVIVCAGWNGATSLEDTLFAGALIDRLAGQYPYPMADGALMAHTIFQNHKDNLVKAVEGGSHGQRLLGLDRDHDIAYCLQQSIFPVVPLLRGEEIISGKSI